MSVYQQGDIVSIKFPFVNDPADGKERPAIVISNADSNLDGDVILACITTTIRVTPFSYMLDNSHLSRSLPANSEVRCNKLMTLKQSLITRKVSSLNQDKVQDLLDKVWSSMKKK
jgi:mRNA-degrading endonuclease toxin of MazEF toxin-antitoxin module